MPGTLTTLGKYLVVVIAENMGVYYGSFCCVGREVLISDGFEVVPVGDNGWSVVVPLPEETDDDDDEEEDELEVWRFDEIGNLEVDHQLDLEDECWD